MRDLIPMVIALPVVYLLGALLGVGRAAPAPDAIGARCATGVAAISAIALALAAGGWFSGPAVAAGALAAAAIAAVVRRPGVRELVPRRPTWPEWIALGLATAFVVVATPAFPYVLGGRDPGIYVQAGAMTERTGGVVQHDQPIGDVPAAARQHLAFQQGAWPGMLERPPGSGRVEPLGFQLWPATIAAGRAFGGGLGLWILPMLAGITLLALGQLAALLAPPPRRHGARVAAIVLAGCCVAYLWYARYPTTEMLTAMLLMTGFAVWAAERSSAAGIAAGALLGLSVGARLDPILVLAPTFAAWGVVMLCTGRLRRPHVLLLASFAVTAGVALLEAHSAASGTWQVLVDVGRSRDKTLEVAGLVMMGAGAVFALVAYRARHRLAALTERFARPLGYAWVVGLGLLYAVIIVRGVVQISWRGLDWLFDYLSVPGVALGGVALMVLAWHEWLEDRFERAGPFLGAFVLSIPLYFASPRVSPDQFWGIRRFVPVVIPLWCVLVAAAVAILARTMARRVAGAAVVLGLAAYGAVLSAPTIGRVEYGGAPAALDRVTAALGDRTSLTLWGPANSTVADINRIADSAPVRFGAGAEYLKRRFGVPVMSSTNLDDPAVDAWLQGQPGGVSLVTWRSAGLDAQPTLPVLDYTKFDAELVEEVPVSISEFQTVIDEVPRHQDTTAGSLFVFRLVPADPQATGKPSAVDLPDAPPGSAAGMAGLATLDGHRAAQVSAARAILHADPGASTVRVTAGIPATAAGPQAIDVLVNGRPVKTATLQPGVAQDIVVPMGALPPRVVVGVQPHEPGPHITVGRIGVE